MPFDLLQSLSEGIGTASDFAKAAKSEQETRRLRRLLEEKKKKELEKIPISSGNILRDLALQADTFQKNVERGGQESVRIAEGRKPGPELQKALSAATKLGQTIPIAIVGAPSQAISALLTEPRQPGEDPLAYLSRQPFAGETISEMVGESRFGNVPLLAPAVGLAAELIIPGGGELKGIVNTLAKTNKVSDIATTLRGMGIADDLVDEASPIIAKTKNSQEIQEIIQDVVRRQSERATNVTSKITAALKSAQPVRKSQEALFSAERARRTARVEAVGGRVGGEKGFFAQLGQLKGPLQKKQFEAIRKQFSQKEIDSLFDAVQQSKKLLPLEKITAKGGLAKLFEGSIPTKNEIGLLRDVFPEDFISAILQNRPIGQKILGFIGEVINVPRTMMASMDFSAPLRQGIFLIGKPRQFLPNFVRMFKYAFSERAYQGMMDDIIARPTYRLMRQHKLALTDIGGSLTQREEAFMGNIVEKVPGIGQLVRISNRAYTGFLNRMRADVFDDLVRKSEALGVTKTDRMLDSMTSFVNAATGRGNLPAILERAAPVLNATFFSPRLMSSRINLLNPWFYTQLDPFVRKEALKSLLTFASTAGTILGLASLNDDVEVGADPRSADFGKIKVGNTRYDIFGGFQQYMRIASQLVTGEIVSTTTGRTFTVGEGFGLPTRFDIALRFFEHKTAPIPSFIIGLLKGETAVGEDFDIPTQVINRFISFVVQDLYDISQEKGIEHIWEGAPAIFGVGVQTYGKQELAFGESKLGEPTAQVRPVQEMSEKIRETVLGELPLGSSKSFSVEAYYDQLNELSKEEAAKIFEEIARTNPDLAEKITKVHKETVKGITPKDKDLKAKGVSSGDRALAIQKEFEKLKTDEEKAKLWNEYTRKGIITKEVARQLRILFNR